MTDYEKDRLEDFKKVLTYHILSKIKYHFSKCKDPISAYYSAPKIYKQMKNKEIAYNQKLYTLIIKFNDTSLSSDQVQCIFGKYTDSKKWIPYKKLIEADSNIKVFNKGTITKKLPDGTKVRYQIQQRYQLPYEYIKGIWENKELLAKALNKRSDFYSNRQRRLIETQIFKKKNYHYKSNNQIIEEKKAEELANELFKDGFFDEVI